MGKRSGRKTEIDRLIGERIRMRRNEMGMSQGELGKAVDLTFQQIQKYEKGTNAIAPSRLMDLAETLGVPFWFLMNGSKGGAGVVPESNARLLQDRDAHRMLTAFSSIQNKPYRMSLVEMAEQFFQMEVRGRKK